jgi:hypothetical protein
MERILVKFLHSGDLDVMRLSFHLEMGLSSHLETCCAIRPSSSEVYVFKRAHALGAM